MQTKIIIPVFALFMAITQWSAAEITYSLVSGNDTWPADKRAAIVTAMDEAVAFYNAHGYFNKALTVDYVPSVPTADANYSGHIRFGGQIGTRTAMHEISHTLGVGTVYAWGVNIVDGNWTGPHANARLALYNGPTAVLKADVPHFWSSTGDSYGLNYDTQDSPLIRIRHVRMVAAFRWDMGIVTDSDFDGMPDDWETFRFNTLTFDGNSDVDGDGISNLDEYNADTNPAEAGPTIVTAWVITNTPAAADQASFDFGPATISAFRGAGTSMPNALINSANLAYIGVNSSAVGADNNANAINDADGVAGGSDQERLRIAMKPGSALTGLVWNWSRAAGPLPTDGVSISGFTEDPGAVFSGGLSGIPTYSGGTLRFQISAFNGTENTVYFMNHEASRGATLEITAADSTQAGPQLAIRSLSFTPPGMLFYSDFDGHSGVAVLAGSADNTTGSASVSVPWSRHNAVTSISNPAAISTGDSGTASGFVELYNGAAVFANSNNVFIGRNHNLDTDRSTSKRGYSLDFTVDKGFSLDKLTVRSGHATANGVDQGYPSTLVYTLSGGTLAAPVSASSVEDYTGSFYNTVVFDLAGTVIGAGTYTLEVYQTQMTGGGAYAMFNGVALTTTNTVPVPGIKNIGVLQDHAGMLAAADLIAIATDVESDPLSIPSVTNASLRGGSVAFAGGDITYTPPPGYVGADEFTYTLSDDQGAGATGTVSISVVAEDADYNRLSPTEIANGAIELGYQGLPWADYAFEHATNLTDPVVWTPVYTNIAGTSGWLNFTNSTTEPEGYFRVRSIP